mgnify:CR=1 FL=1|uniref:Uncharacterized protein n=1 Tax=viral metagenome TaxID=1070528 RepID=A0A6C0AC09_9ZZZZ
MEDVINNFNDVAIQMLTELKKIIPHSVILDNVDLVKYMTEKDDKKSILIDNFVYYVLKYKTEIDDSNENFFLKHDFNDSANGESNILKIINEIKNMWKTIEDPDNKKNIFSYLQVLCFYAEEYFLIIDEMKQKKNK